MKPLPLTIVILVAALASWWIFTGSEPTPPSDIDAAIEKDARKRTTPSSELPDPPAGTASAKASATVEVAKPEPEKKKVYMLPLADKFIENATWEDEDALVVLQHAAQAAGKILSVDRSCRKRLEQARVTMRLGKTPVPKVLDHVLQPHIMSWQVERERLVVYDNDD